MEIKELILKAGSVSVLKNFYSNILDLNVETTGDREITIKAGSTKIKFTELKNGSENPFYHFAFNIPENLFAEAKSWISERVDLIKSGDEDEFDFKSWNAHSVYFYDPAGNIVELIARHNLKNSSIEKFSGNSILNVSEIGLPVRNVGGFFEKIKNELQIPFFSGDGKTFTAAGNDDGLFIIVPEGRKWFPDCPAAKIYPVEIKISGDDLLFEYGVYKTFQ